MMEVDVLFFARARELAGRSSARIALPEGSGVREAAEKLRAEYPRLAGALSACRFSVNEEFVGEDHGLSPGAVLGVLPPVSGG